MIFTLSHADPADGAEKSAVSAGNSSKQKSHPVGMAFVFQFR
jgi:hypothetical protein